jgi:hypothetical protein
MEQEKTPNDETVEIHQFWHLAWIGTIVTGVLAASLWISPWVFTEDPDGLYRYILLKTPIALISIWLIILSGCVFDWITPRNSLETIATNPIASAILYAALFVALSITMAFG